MRNVSKERKRAGVFIVTRGRIPVSFYSVSWAATQKNSDHPPVTLQMMRTTGLTLGGGGGMEVGEQRTDTA